MAIAQPVTQEVTSVAGIEAMLRAHQTNLINMLTARKETSRLQKLCDTLVKDRCLSFAVTEIQTHLPEVLANSTRFENLLFIQEANCYVAILVLPAVAPADAMAYVPNGYLAVLGRYLQNLRFIPNNILGDKPPKHWAHLGHWIYCCDGKQAGVHLSLVVDVQDPNPGKQFIIAQDLLTPDERKQLGL